MKTPIVILAGVFSVLAWAASGGAENRAGTDSAAVFINTREAAWFKHKSPEIQEAYPFGHSNTAHNAVLAQRPEAAPVSKDWFLRNKRYLAESDWYVVEWHYGATSVATGQKQVESSLCFAEVKDQQIVKWIEFFDDTVGELQMAGKLPLPAAAEEPGPWPALAVLGRVYRP